LTSLKKLDKRNLFQLFQSKVKKRGNTWKLEAQGYLKHGKGEEDIKAPEQKKLKPKR
jgi:hypothetical protein